MICIKSETLKNTYNNAYDLNKNTQVIHIIQTYMSNHSKTFEHKSVVTMCSYVCYNRGLTSDFEFDYDQ